MTQRESAAVDQHIELADGRRLGFAEFGNPDGRPLVYLHALPGSRIEGRLLHAPALQRGFRVIAPDRPGYGLSDPLAGRALGDFADDLLALVGALRLERFALLGHGGGAPYAESFAFQHPDRLSAVGVVSGFVPVHDPVVLAAMPWALRLQVKLMQRGEPTVWWLAKRRSKRFALALEAAPERLFAEVERQIEQHDRALLGRADVAALVLDSQYEAFRQGPDCVVEELRVLTEPWGFDSTQVRTHVSLWHGERDVMVPAVVARLHAQRLAKCAPRFYPSHGQMLMFDIAHEVLAELGARPEPGLEIPA